jgi:hypothetical protein
MLADARQRTAHAGTPTAHQQRQQNDVGRAAIVGLHRNQAAARLEVRVVQQLLGPHDRRVGQARGLELGRQFIGAMVLQDLAQPSQQLGAYRDALRIRLQSGILGEVRSLEDLAQREELLVADGTDEELLAFGEREDVVDAPCRDTRGHRRRRLARHRELLHMLGRKEHAVLEQRALHFLAAAGTVALAQCREDADCAEHAAHDVVD